MLGTVCSIDKRHGNGLFVTGNRDQLRGVQAVSCKDLDQISPLSDVVRTIVRLTTYNGFGCINFKFASGHMSLDAIDAYLEAMPAAQYPSPESITTDFGEEGVSMHHAASLKAVPKMFDFNARIGGSHVTFQYAEFTVMMRMYLAAVAEEEE